MRIPALVESWVRLLRVRSEQVDDLTDDNGGYGLGG